MNCKLETPENLFDHELLEILLFNVLPRVNTNPVAHALLERFCSLSGIFKASLGELKSVRGVGDKTANFIKTVGLCYERVGRTEGVAVLKTFGDCKSFVTMRLKDRTEEYLELYFTEKNGKTFKMFSYTSFDMNSAAASAGAISDSLASSKPYGVIVAHNHLTGSCKPSANDDVFTSQLQLVCGLHGVKLLDHLIYAGKDNIYSYRDAGVLDVIRRECSLDAAIKWKKKNLN